MNQQIEHTATHIESRRISQHRKKARLHRNLKIGIGCTAAVLLGFTAFLTVRAYTQPIDITLKLDKAVITQGEELPALKATAVYKGKSPDKMLDKKRKLTIKDFINELNSGKYYTLSYNADASVDNTYPVKIILNKDFQKRMKEKWASRVRLDVQDGTLVVKNRLGAWEGKKFRLNSGEYMTGDFLTSGGNTYYFDENGDMVTGQRQIGLKQCTFDKDGRLLSKGEASVQPDRPMIALTFDDGPGERTQELLDVLERYNAHATFFMQGMNVPKYPDAVKKMLETGCELGNHTYNHPDLTKQKPEKLKKQIADTNAAIQNICGQPADVLRPPYGAINDAVRADAGMPLVLWSVDTLDWKTKDTAATIESIRSSASDGAVILLHDIHSFSIDAALAVIPELTRQGYQLVTVSELAAAKGVSLENGKTYGSF